MIRKISASLVFIDSHTILKNGVVTVDENGIIQSIEDNGGNLKESQHIEHYNGLLVPGFVNTHTHLELSHLKGKIDKEIGLDRFVGQVVRLRSAEQQEIEDAQKLAIRQMKMSGTVAAGDISNGSDSFSVKKESDLLFYTFIELFGLDPANAEEAMNGAQKLIAEYPLPYISISPHAPYSTNSKLLALIKEHAENACSVLSMHNQECDAENEFFLNKTGKLAEAFERIGFDLNKFAETGKNSLESVTEYLPQMLNKVLVHNSVTNKEDIDILRQNMDLDTCFWATCPKSNLYIENKLPDYNLFRSEGLQVTIGTDSLASNDTLSIIEEMKVITSHFKEIPLVEIISWATINGAKALGFADRLGSFEEGKRPGINLIENMHLHSLELTEKSTVRVIA